METMIVLLSGCITVYLHRRVQFQCMFVCLLWVELYRGPDGLGDDGSEGWEEVKVHGRSAEVLTVKTERV